MDKGIRRGHSVYTMSGGINKSYCLVLGGGGARGAYEIGVWKALRKLEIPINAVAGTSAGALNAAFVAQDDFETAEKLFRNITINQIANIPREFLTAGKIDRDLGKLRRLSGYLLEHRGLDTSPLKNLIESHLKEDVIRNSGMDFGLVTYNLSSFKPMHCFLEDIPAGRLSEFLFASASHPLFGTAKIDKAHLTDGGVTDNIPYNMMKQRGYRRIIAVDLSGMGRVRKFRTENSETVYIKNSLKLAGVMDFTPEDSCRAMDLGYLDTLRSFGEIEGVRYFIHPEYDTLKAFSQKLSSPETDTLIAETAGKLQSSRENTLLNDRPLGSLLPPELSMHRFPIIPLMESAAVCLSIPREKLYSAGELLYLVRKGFDELEAEPPDEKRKLKGVIRRIRREFKRLNKENLFQLPPARYASALNTVLGERDNHLAIRLMQPFFPELPAALLMYRLIKSVPEGFSIDRKDR